MSRRVMLWILLGVILFVWPAHATTVQFQVDPTLIGVPLSNPVDIFSAGLNGTPLAGQNLSLDLVLSGGVIARLIANGTLSVLLIVDTTAGTFPGFAGPTTGFLLDAKGTPLGNPEVAGRAQSSDGSFSVGFAASPGGDVGGVHFETVFPPSLGFPVTVTDLRLRFAPIDSLLLLGSPALLPEPSTLILLLTGALVTLFVCRRCARV